MMDDTELLQRYVSTGCAEAFGQLVGRHIDFVYASARRMTRDAHLAEDVTQGVFIVLARKAAHVRSGAVLPSWLHSTTRNVSSNILSVQSRRRHHEEKAAAMKAVVQDDSDALKEDETLAAAIDDALGRLGTSDRGAVVMRYLQGKSIREVGAAMGISPEAAQKRVSRAVARMRDYFAQRGLALDESGMIGGLSRQTAQVAPTALASVVAAKSLSAATLPAAANSIFHWLAWTSSAKVAAILCVSAILIGATVAVVKSDGAAAAGHAPATAGTTAPALASYDVTLSAKDIWQPYVPNETPGTDVLPIRNEELIPSSRNGTEIVCGLDDSVHRGDGPAAASVRSLAPNANKGGAIAKKIDATPYRGKRIRLSGYLKSKDVTAQAAMALWVFDDKDFALAQDDMGGHWLEGTNDWKRYDIVEDVPSEAVVIIVNAHVAGAGTLWTDGMELSVVDQSVPVNDDHRWRSWTPYPAKIKTTFDEAEQRNGHGTICISAADVGKFDWNAYDHTLDDITSFRGKRLKLSVMIKAKDVIGSAGPQIRIVGPDNKTAKTDEQGARRPVKGTSNWMRYSTFINVPGDAKGMSIGVQSFGEGTIWIDEVRLEIVK